LTDKNSPTRFIEWLGYTTTPDFSKARWLGAAIGGFAVLTITGAVLFSIVQFFIAATNMGAATDAAARNYALILAALLSIPFVIWRVLIAQKQADIAEQGLITDRINKAVEQLGAEKTIKDGDHEKTVPNLEVRLGAIYALERIAQDSLRDHIPVMEILCAYVRINAPSSERKRSPHEVFRELSEDTEFGKGMHPEEVYKHSYYVKANPFGWDPTELNSNNLKNWAMWLPSPRGDIQAALAVIGRRPRKNITHEKRQGYLLDLSRCNLQKAFILGHFKGCDFTETLFDGATLLGEFNRIKASYTSWQAAEARKIVAYKSDLFGANLNLAYFGHSKLRHSNFKHATMVKTNFNAADVRFCDWFEAEISGVFFYENADASWGRFHRCSTQNMNGINEGPSNNLFAVDEVAKENMSSDRLFNETNALDNERDAHNAWLKAKAAANL